jgi:hypothetical protein
MRVGLLILALGVGLGLAICGRIGLRAVAIQQTKSSSERIALTASSDSARIDFAKQIRPIMEARCQPCHFSGGVMYQRLPFDRPETIVKLGTKLFTRIKDENQQRLIREFLSQQSAHDRASP